MPPDIVNYRQFYASTLGRVVRHRLWRAIQSIWPQLPPQTTVVGMGYAQPLLAALARRTPSHASLVLMPAALGAIYWPVHGANRSVLCDLERPPLRPASQTHLVLLHAGADAAALQEALLSAAALLLPGGRALLCVTHARGLWAYFGAQPFRRNPACTRRQLMQLCNAAGLSLRSERTGLFALPFAHPLALRLSSWLEWLGPWLMPGLGGVLIVEAEKQIYAHITGTLAPVTRRVAAASARPAATSRIRAP